MTKDTKFSDDDWRSGGHGVGYYKSLFAPGVIERNLGIVDSLRPVAERIGCSLPQLALAWVFHQKGATGAIAGSRSPSHVRENSEAGSIELSADDLEEIDGLLEPAAG